MNKFLVPLLIVLFSNLANAADSAPTDLTGKDLQIISTGTPRVYIYNALIQGCTDSTTPVLILGGVDENPLGKEIYSALLMAKASGKKIILQSSKCWSERSMPEITSMYIKD
ncbi:hypothetical protein ACU6U9_14555 [Pseudomonas sp. HK3]